MPFDARGLVNPVNTIRTGRQSRRVPAPGFGHIQRPIGRLQQLADGRRGNRQRRGADRGSQTHAARCPPQEGVTGDALAQPPSHLAGNGAAGGRQHDGEFIAAVPSHHIPISGARSHYRRRLEQHPASIVMPVPVVHPLEAIEIHEQQRQRPARPRRPFRLAAKRPSERTCIPQPRQVVGDRQRLGPLQAAGVVDGNGGRLERYPQRPAHGRRQPRRCRSHPAVHADQGRNGPAAASHRQRHRSNGGRARRLCVHLQIRRPPRTSVSQHPGTKRPHRRFGARGQCSGSHDLCRPFRVGTDHGPSRRRQPRRGAVDYYTGDLAGIE